MKKAITLALLAGVVLVAANGLAQDGPKDPSQIGVRTAPVRPFVPLGSSPWCAPISQPIPFDENNPVSLQIPVDPFIITDLDVDVDITHSWTGDIVVNVTSPVVGPVTVWDNECGSNDDLIVTIDGDAAPRVCSNPMTGVWSDDDLGDAAAAFDGTQAAGIWTVDLTDTAGGDSGQVNGVCLVTTPIPVELKGLEIE